MASVDPASVVEDSHNAESSADAVNTAELVLAIEEALLKIHSLQSQQADLAASIATAQEETTNWQRRYGEKEEELSQAQLAHSALADTRASRIAELEQALEQAQARLAVADQGLAAEQELSATLSAQLSAEQNKNIDHGSAVEVAQREAAQWRDALAAKQNEFTQAHALYEAQINAATNRAAQLVKELGETRLCLSATQESLAAEQTTTASLRAEHETAIQTIRTLQSESRKLAESVDRWKVELQDEVDAGRALKAALHRAEIELFSSRHELAELNARFSRKLQRIAELEDDIASAEKKATADAAAFKDLQESMGLLLSERADFLAQLAAHSTTLSEMESHLGAERGRTKELQEEHVQLSARLAEAGAALHQAQHERMMALAGLEIRIAELVEFEQKLREATSRAEAQAIEAQKHFHSSEAERRRADDLEHKLAEVSATLSDLRKEVDLRDLEIRGLKHGFVARLRAPEQAFRRFVSRLRRKMGRKGGGANPLFDEDYYLRAYPDVRESGIDAYAHYLRFGVEEGRNPNAVFDTAWYLDTNPDVATAGMNPLLHYYQSGAAEGRNPHPLFSTTWYVEQNPELKDAGCNPLEHYLTVLKTAQ